MCHTQPLGIRTLVQKSSTPHWLIGEKHTKNKSKHTFGLRQPSIWLLLLVHLSQIGYTDWQQCSSVSDRNVSLLCLQMPEIEPGAMQNRYD